MPQHQHGCGLEADQVRIERRQDDGRQEDCSRVRLPTVHALDAPEEEPEARAEAREGRATQQVEAEVARHLSTLRSWGAILYPEGASMPGQSNTHDSLNPLVEGALGIARDLAWNVLIEQFEETFTISGYDPEVVGRVETAINTSIRKGYHVGLSDDDAVDAFDVLLAFGAIARASKREVAVVALSKQGEQCPLSLVSGVAGTPQRVAVPEAGLREIRSRMKRGIASHVVIVHNHPQGILHNLLGETLLGPSAQDRRMVTSAYRTWFVSGRLIHVDFYLVEDGVYRKFIIPSAAEVWDWAVRLGLVGSRR